MKDAIFSEVKDPENRSRKDCVCGYHNVNNKKKNKNHNSTRAKLKIRKKRKEKEQNKWRDLAA